MSYYQDARARARRRKSPSNLRRGGSVVGDSVRGLRRVWTL